MPPKAYGFNSLQTCEQLGVNRFAEICSTCGAFLEFGKHGKLGMLRLHHYRSFLSLAGGLCGQQFGGVRDTGWFGKMGVSGVSAEPKVP